MTDSDNTRIRRAKHGKTNPYFMMLRDTAQDLEISAEALGILTYLLSKPDTWDTQIGDLAKRKGVGRDRARRIVNELIKARYMKREKVREKDGTFNYTIEVYETPHPIQLLESSDWNPVTGEPLTENPTLDNTEEDSTEENKEKEKETTSSGGDFSSDVSEITTLYMNNIGVITPIVSDELKAYVQEVGKHWVADAIRVAVRANKRSMRYISGVIEKWRVDGKTDITPQASQPIQPAPELDLTQYETATPEMIAEYDKIINEALNEMGAKR